MRHGFEKILLKIKGKAKYTANKLGRYKNEKKKKNEPHAIGLGKLNAEYTFESNGTSAAIETGPRSGRRQLALALGSRVCLRSFDYSVGPRL